jgi:hypothetical protein
MGIHNSLQVFNICQIIHGRPLSDAIDEFEAPHDMRYAKADYTNE